MEFSFALIARNESKTLPRLIESLSDFQSRGGKIVLLDTGSTDNTVQVARDLWCEVHAVGDMFKITIDADLARKINEKFCAQGEKPIIEAWQTLFNFAAARNYIADLAPTDMIATPDCDEIWTKLDIDKINALIEQGAEQFEYQFVFSHDEKNEPLVQFMHSKFYNRKKLKRVGVIHEVLQGDAKRIYLDESIAKLEHYQNVETNRDWYLKGLAYDCYFSPQNDRNSHYFARELMYRWYIASAKQEFLRHISMWDKYDTTQSMIHLGEIALKERKLDEAIKRLMQSYHCQPWRREPLMKLAEYYAVSAMPHHAIPLLHAVLAIPQWNFYSNFAPYYTFMPHDLLTRAYAQIWNIEMSNKHANLSAIAKWQDVEKQEYPLISFVIPTRGDREEWLRRVLKSIEELSYPHREIVVQKDSEKTCPENLRDWVAKAKGEWIVFASDDIAFDHQSVMKAYNACQNNGKHFVSFNTGTVSEDEWNICEHFMIHRSLIPENNEIFDCEFNHVGVDNLLRYQMKKKDQAFRCDDAIVHHYHRSKWSHKDETYQKWRDPESVKKDRELLEQKKTQI